MSEEDRSRPEGAAAYRDQRVAAEARVEALERELDEARQRLAAMAAPAAAEGDPSLRRGMSLLFWSALVGVIISGAETLIFRMLPGRMGHEALHTVLAITSSGHLVSIALAIAGLLHLRRPSAALGARALVGISLAGHLCVALLWALSCIQLLSDSFGFSYALSMVQQVAWRVAVLLGVIPLLLLYHRFGRRIDDRRLRRLVLGAAVLFAVHQILALAATLMRWAGADGPLSLHQLRWWLGLGFSLLLAVVASAAARAASSAQLGDARG